MMEPLLPTLNQDLIKSNKPRAYGRPLCIFGVIAFTIGISIISYFHFGPSILDDTTSSKVLSRSGNDNSNDKNDVATPVIPSDASETTSYYNANGADDLMTSMPGLDEDSCIASVTNCAFNQYSGYLLANNNAEIHYWFIEADTEDDATSKPLFFWTNGGPGCSGMDGLLTEMGPWRVNDDQSISYNPYTWLLEVNMVFLEQPYGVGFSVVEDGDDVVGGDVNAANDMDAVIRNFLTKFPDYADADVYTSAESWGGHYVPMTAYKILQNNAEGVTPTINYKGFLLGNPYTDWYENTYGFVGDIYGHGMMDGVDYDTWREKCWDNPDNIDDLPICSAIYSRAYMSSYNSNVYALDWPQCPTEMDWGATSGSSGSRKQHRKRYDVQKRSHLHRHAQRFMRNVLDHKNYEELNMKMERSSLHAMYTALEESQMSKQSELTSHDESLTPIDDMGRTFYSISGASSSSSEAYLPCIENNMNTWLNTEVVQTALHVKTPGNRWNMCSNEVWDAWPESDYDAYMQEYYEKIITGYSEDLDLKLAIYSGDDDSVCGLTGTQYWLSRWDGFEADSTVNWNPWEDQDGQLGGYYTIYHQEDHDDFNALHFLTVRTAGHMVPTTEPARALTLLRKYLYELTTTN